MGAGVNARWVDGAKRLGFGDAETLDLTRKVSHAQHLDGPLACRYAKVRPARVLLIRLTSYGSPRTANPARALPPGTRRRLAPNHRAPSATEHPCTRLAHAPLSGDRTTFANLLPAESHPPVAPPIASRTNFRAFGPSRRALQSR